VRLSLERQASIPCMKRSNHGSQINKVGGFQNKRRAKVIDHGEFESGVVTGTNPRRSSSLCSPSSLSFIFVLSLLTFVFVLSLLTFVFVLSLLTFVSSLLTSWESSRMSTGKCRVHIVDRF
jgi:hypothetical protein